MVLVRNLPLRPGNPSLSNPLIMNSSLMQVTIVRCYESNPRSPPYPEGLKYKVDGPVGAPVIFFMHGWPDHGGIWAPYIGQLCGECLSVFLILLCRSLQKDSPLCLVRHARIRKANRPLRCCECQRLQRSHNMPIGCRLGIFIRANGRHHREDTSGRAQRRRQRDSDRHVTRCLTACSPTGGRL